MNKNHMPDWDKEAFICPSCGAYAQQRKKSYEMDGFYVEPFIDSKISFCVSICRACNKPAFWIVGYSEYLDRDGHVIYKDASVNLKYPLPAIAPKPNPDMPEDVLSLYNEAASVANLAPRAAAALLRLAIQHLCIHEGASGNNINEDIDFLLSKGLPGHIGRAMARERIHGHHPLQPGLIDTDDTSDTQKLFHLVNIITTHFITHAQLFNEELEDLPGNGRITVEKHKNGRIRKTG